MNFSIVTPTSNSARYIAQTMESVLSQEGDFSIEYIIVDNVSSDGTTAILKNYETLIAEKTYPVKCRQVSFRWVSERDSGMYHAINKGFSLASGDIFAWINSDDVYLPHAFALIAGCMMKFPRIKWLKGITSYINSESQIYEAGKCYEYYQDWIAKGLYGQVLPFIQQDSVFWRSGLWKMVGGLDGGFKLAGDYDLWMRFSRHAPLYSLDAPVSCFRKVEGQLSENVDEYHEEYTRIVPPCQETFERIGFYRTKRKGYRPRLRPLLFWRIFGRHKYYLVRPRNGASGPYFRLIKKSYSDFD